MKPLELGFIKGIWNSALSILSEETKEIGDNLQLWFPWSSTWRGQDLSGNLPPTSFPPDLLKPGVNRFGGRFWRAVSVKDTTWLISVQAPKSSQEKMENWQLIDRAKDSLSMLSDFVRLECLLGLSMRILENQAKEQIGHWDRVRNLSVAIGSELNLSDRELADIELAAMLHDLGKIGLPEEMLKIAGPLDEAAKKRIKTHSIVGAAMIREIPGMERIADYVLYHHEAYDGSGYPEGLKGDEIPLGSMIISVADSFDSMTHYRTYAIERTYHESLDEIKKEQGKYCPIVLDALQSVLKRLGIFESKPLVGNNADWSGD